jgi:hypothetical protein
MSGRFDFPNDDDNEKPNMLVRVMPLATGAIMMALSLHASQVSAPSAAGSSSTSSWTTIKSFLTSLVSAEYTALPIGALMMFSGLLVNTGYKSDRIRGAEMYKSSLIMALLYLAARVARKPADWNLGKTQSRLIGIATSLSALLLLASQLAEIVGEQTIVDIRQS